MSETASSEADRFLALLKSIEHELETYCRRLIWESQEAPDALQNAVMRAFAAFNCYHQDASFRAWMFKILTHEAFALNRKHSRIARHPIHAALAALQPGDKLHMARDEGGNLELRNAASTPVARLSKRAQVEWSTRLDAIKEVRFLAAVLRTADQEADSARRERLQVQTWEIPLVEIVSGQPE